MEHLFLINPAAGKADQSRRRTEEIHRLCQARGLSYRIEVSKQAGDITRLARQAAQTGKEVRIYACGGDGTMNEVVTGVVGYPNVAVTSWLGGSGNDFARNFSDFSGFFDLSRLLDGQEVEVDVVRCNDRYGLNVLCVGLDSRIGTAVAKYKHLPLLSGHGAYVLSTAMHVVQRLWRNYTITLNGQTLQGPRTMICICNGAYYGGGMHPIPEADPADGVLNVLVVNKISRLVLPNLFVHYQKGQYAKFPQYATAYQTRELHIAFEQEEPVNLDGELLYAREVTIRLAGEKLRYIIPKAP